MKKVKSEKLRSQQPQERRGAAMVEFAIFCPLLLTLVLGTIELGIATRASTILHSAVREGGRLASMDFRDKVADNETANQKVKRDIKNFISAAGLNGSDVLVSIRHEGDSDGNEDGDNFDLEDPNNHLKMFRIRAKISYADVTLFPLDRYMRGKTLAAVSVFRSANSTLSN